jgi:putative DNA primase/helicase
LLIGAPNGIIDLRTGELLQGSREHLISFSLGVPYDPNAKEPERWIQFLHEIFRSDSKSSKFSEQLMVKYLKRLAGYTLTGQTVEQIWCLLIGEGANGKSVLLNVFKHVFGDDYGKTVAFKMFELTGQRPSVGDGTEQLKHKRFVSAREAIEGLPLDEARVKAWTGSDDAAVRGMYTPYSEFKPELKLYLCANQKPTVKDDSHGFWRRVHVIVFPNVFDGKANPKDERLQEKLEAEAPGILKWMVDGSLEWQKHGLNPPAPVTDATAEYQNESDHITPFLDECCELAPDASCGATPLYDEYKRWATARQIPDSRRLSITEFGSRMKKRLGQKPDDGHRRAGNVYIGVRLKSRR